MQRLGGHPLVPRELVRLALDNDELVPWFQPVVSARTGKLTGCEILMRQRVTR
ncbi:TPA: EAL domain-containing protein, partial [Escherichia coli]|nr:EAL domain-containing protein [Escherichia coli]